MKNLLCPSLITVVVLLATASARATIIPATLNSHDYILGERQSGAPATGYYINQSFALNAGVGGATGARDHRNPVYGFLLPVLDGPITSVSFSATIASLSSSGGAMEVDLYGLSTTNPDGSGITLFFEGALDGSQTLLQATFASTSSTVGSTPSADVTAFIASLYTGNTPNQAEVFFRLNSDRALDPANTPRRVTFTNASPTLVINTVPEPSSIALLLGGLFSGGVFWQRRRIRS